MNNRLLLIFAAACLLAPAVLAQDQDAVQVQRFDRQLESLRRDTRLEVNPQIPVSERTYLDYGGFFGFTFLSFDTPELKNVTMRQEEVGAYADLIFDGANEFFFRGRLFHRDFNPGDRFNSDGEGIDGRIDNLFYRFDLERYEAAYKGMQTQNQFTVKLGRDLVLWGNGLTLSTDMDGGVVDLGYQNASLELIAGVTPLDTVDFDSSRPRFDSRTERGLYGALASVREGTHKFYVYGLNSCRDYNDDELTADDMIDGAAAIPTRFNYDSYYVGVGASGALTDRLSYGVEAVYEGGHTLSSSFTLDDAGKQVQVPQTRDGITAYALDARVDYLFADAHHSRLSGEVIFASGDSSRVDSTSATYGGNVPGTRDRAFNALGLPDVGSAFAPAVSNLILFRVGATTFPFIETKMFRQMQVGAEFYAFAKAVTDAPIDEETTDNRWLGIEPDVYMNWQITSDVALSARYGLFVPGDAIVNDGKMRQFLYTQITFAF